MTPQDAVELAPLRNSHEADQLETELKALFLLMFETHIRPAERTVNTAGTPHLGPFTQVERAVKAEGLGLKRRGSEQAMRYMFRSWRARNPKRGLHLLRTYLQLLWPNGWSMWQMWCDQYGVYPYDLSKTQAEEHFLTSRVQVEIEAGATDGADVLAVTPAMRSVLPARMLLSITVVSSVFNELAIATGFHSGQYIQVFSGECTRPDDDFGIADGLYLGAAVHTFNGSFQ